MTKRIALITWAGLPEGTQSERLLLRCLAADGVDASMADWRDPAIDFGQFDLLVLRSCWDYHLQPHEFSAWLGAIAWHVPVLNDIETVLWNSNKFYLRELPSRQIEIPPTCFVSAGSMVSHVEFAEIESWPGSVVKPAISASAHKTWLFERGTLPSPQKLAALMQGEAYLVQRFIPEIQTAGEISFIYIDGVYSHAMLKQPAPGDFRVQKEFGGCITPFSPPPALLAQSDDIAARVPQVCDSLYCRIDVVERNGRLLLMELELIEPELFLGLCEGSAARFAQAILRRLANHKNHFAADLHS